MQITTYAELKAAIASYNTHSDVPSLVDAFIDLAEARLSRELRVRAMVATSTGTTTTTGEITLPSDLVEIVSLRLDLSPPKVLEYRPSPDFFARWIGTLTGEPSAFTIVGSTATLGPAPDSAYAYVLDYYQRIPALSDSATTNWLVTQAPDVYLYACLAESERLLQNPSGVEFWEAQLGKAAESLRASDARARGKAGLTRVRPL